VQAARRQEREVYIAIDYCPQTTNGLPARPHSAACSSAGTGRTVRSHPEGQLSSRPSRAAPRLAGFPVWWVPGRLAEPRARRAGPAPRVWGGPKRPKSAKSPGRTAGGGPATAALPDPPSPSHCTPTQPTPQRRAQGTHRLVSATPNPRSGRPTPRHARIQPPAASQAPDGPSDPTQRAS